jgi:hypothetical protein
MRRTQGEDEQVSGFAMEQPAWFAAPFGRNGEASIGMHARAFLQVSLPLCDVYSQTPTFTELQRIFADYRIFFCSSE